MKLKPVTFSPAVLYLLSVAAFPKFLQAQSVPRDTRADSWVANDALGRTLPVCGDKNSVTISAPRTEKFVGIFYFLWLGEHGHLGPFDNSKIMARDSDALQKPDSPLWGPVGAPHHWGESAFGYYLSKDEWVLRKHAQMLSDAGIDVVIFDVTNQLTYPRSYRALCKVWSQMRREGNRTPQIAFLAPFSAPANVVKTLYADFYRPGIASELWFQCNGKPLIMADPAEINGATMVAPPRHAVSLTPGGTLGQSFRVERPFRAIGGSFPTWSTKSSGMTLSLFDRSGGKLLARHTFENVVDNAKVMLQLPIALPAGNYYLEQSRGQGIIGWWTLGSPVLPMAADNDDEKKLGFAFVNGQETHEQRVIVVQYDAESASQILVEPLTPKPEQRTAVAHEIREFFTFRKPQPSYFEGQTVPDQWSWLEVAPQHVFKNSAGENEQMSVGVAQNAVDGKLGVLSNPRAYGRSFHAGKEPQETDFTGRNFAEQWKRVLEVDPQFVFVTGWNEWIAGRFSLDKNPFHGAGPVSFVDQFNAEFSRDIEPVRGALGDAYYYQLIANIRRFKGARAPQKAGALKTIRIDGQFNDWKSVSPPFLDDRFDTTPRNEESWNLNTRYINTSGRNDFELLKMARDDKSLFAYARTRRAITPRAKEWMHLLLDSDQNAKTGWMGFDFRINATPTKQGGASVEKWVNGAWRTVGSASLRVQGREMEIALPRALLQLSNNPIAVDFKWMDNVGAQDDALNLYRNGDTAPNARFKYRFQS